MENLIEKLKSMGWMYEELYYDDGTVMTYKFRHEDSMNKDAYWEVLIEDHHDEWNCDDYLIYSRYHDPDEKDWFGNQIDTGGSVEYSVMKLIMEFVDILVKRKETNNG